MRIIEDICQDNKSYYNEYKSKVQSVLYYACNIAEVKKLLKEIRKEAISMKEFFITIEELNQIKHAIDMFNARMQATVYYTFKNIESYQYYGWKEVLFQRENEGEKIDSV
ncbi:hypothetical protein DW1_1583 [Proteiniborus sp. DW1]|uniref:hypothetical protein n=1 Tax=Proteiniborus sp. DW1 TaxID=1889883 RepID=UPI00092E1815|nr:hypothetical protein [Proteiniborus sp. DW1]SCG83153.1 hypothetical protein DW1_1583 [Proteiniborus sp. DW1]